MIAYSLSQEHIIAVNGPAAETLVPSGPDANEPVTNKASLDGIANVTTTVQEHLPDALAKLEEPEAIPPPQVPATWSASVSGSVETASESVSESVKQTVAVPPAAFKPLAKGTTTSTTTVHGSNANVTGAKETLSLDGVASTIHAMPQKVSSLFMR
jgi:hypothetical protein